MILARRDPVNASRNDTFMDIDLLGFALSGGPPAGLLSGEGKPPGMECHPLCEEGPIIVALEG